MTLQPLGHRIFVKPDPVATHTASGFEIPGAIHQPRMSGVVTAMGPGGSALRYRARQRALTDACEILESALRQFGTIAPLLLVRDEVAALLGTSDPERDIHVGDRVFFAHDVGRIIRLGEDASTDVIELTEDEVTAVEAAEVAA